MASKKMEVSKPQALAVQVPENWMEEMKKEAKDTAAKEVLFGSRISFKGGDIAIAGEKVAGNKLPVIIVDFACEKAFYGTKFDPQNTKPPICYAMGRDEKDLKPHPQAPEPQAATCAECPHNKFGSADVGKGKACKDGRRLLCMAGNVGLDGVQRAEILPALIPPTSLKGWALYLKGLGEIGRPPFAVLTEISTKKVETYFHVTFELLGNVPNDLAYLAKQRQAGVEEMLFAPYPSMTEDKPAKALPAKKGKGRA
jgi:hypothetical protein